nr:integrase core domain, putative [Tanacetum cinerariifolium]
MVQEASGSHGLLESSGSDKGLELIQEEDTQPSKNTSEVHNVVSSIEVEPQNVEVPIRRSVGYRFYIDLKAMNTEIQFIKDNQVWVLVELPPNGQTVRSKWLFKKKIDMDGKVHTFKARLVAKGYTQTYGVDYGETFSPVADIRAIRILLAIAAFYDYEIWQMDVKTAFLNSHLNLREASYILGIKIIRDRSKQLIALSQNAYLEETLKKFRMENSKKGYTPMIEKPDYRKSQGTQTPSEVQRMQRVLYASAIASFMYAIRCTRPDVAFAQNLCSRF